MAGDVEVIRAVLEGVRPKAAQPALAALSRLEAEHARLVEETKRLRADAERLELLRGYVGRSKVWTPVELATLRRLVFGEPP